MFRLVLQFFTYLIVTTFLSLALIELGVRWFYPRERKTELNCRSSDCVQEQDVVSHLLFRKNIFFKFQDGYWQLQPSRELVVRNWRNGQRLFSYSSNSLGLRGSELRADASEKVLVVGDSVTFGYELAQEDLWVEKLATLFKAKGLNYEFLNASAPSNGFLEYKKQLKNDLEEFNPTYVILATVLNDMRLCCSVEMYSPPIILNDSMLFTHFFEQFSYLLAGSKKEQVYGGLSPSKIADWRAEVVEYATQIKDSRGEFANVIKNNAWHFGLSWSASAWQFAKGELEEIKNIVNKKNAKLIIIQFPIAEQIELGLIDKYPQQQLSRISKELEIEYINLLELILERKNSKSGKVFADSLHLTASGGHLVADILQKDLLERFGIEDK